MRSFRSGLFQGLTLGVFLRLGEKDPTSAAAEPATALCVAGSSFIPYLHHSQTSALDPIPALCHIRTPPGREIGGGEGRSKKEEDGQEGCHPSRFRGCPWVTGCAPDAERTGAINGTIVLTSHGALRSHLEGRIRSVLATGGFEDRRQLLPTRVVDLQLVGLHCP